MRHIFPALSLILAKPRRLQRKYDLVQSCWAHGAVSSLQDRIKIARKGEGHDINLSIQYILNCGGGTAGSCHGGYHTGVFELIQQTGFIPFDT